VSRARSHSRVNAFEPPAERTTFLLKPALGMREDEGTDPASRRGIPSSEELEVVSSLLLSTPASSLLLDMPPLHKGTGHVAEGTRHAAKGTRHAAKGTRHAAEGTRYAAEGTRGRPIVFRGRPIVLRAKQWPSPEKERPPPRQSAGQSVGQIGGRGQNHKKRVMILEEGAFISNVQ
jgi:hypothetical protein